MRATPDPDTGRSWQLVGGQLALDLVNTIAWQRNPDRRADRLPDPARLAAWFVVAAQWHGVDAAVRVSDLDGERGAQVLAAVRELRDACVTVLAAHVDGRSLCGRAMELLRTCYYESLAAAEVSARLPLQHEVRVRAPEHITSALGLAVGELLRRTDLDRLRRCADEECGWFFLDVSRNRSRRWCDPGDCGNRNRVKAFAARARRTA
ncbi:MAG TPA: CGNR zinc finger domain-containing protein [Microlunatus sp.]|nr:CGNR zinc finger domain-containing protein [Microlunatus sp.]